MTVHVTRTGGHRAEIAWDADDDPSGYLARAVESEQLAYALEALGATTDQILRVPVTPEEEDQVLTALRHTATLARILERRAAIQVVQMRDQFGISWRRIATALFDDADRQSSVRRMYESGRRHIGS